MTKLETEFTADLIAAVTQAETLTGVGEQRLIQQAQKDGGARAVKQLLSRGRQTRQFGPLKTMGRLDLSMEALVIRGKYARLFTDEEVNACLETLLDAGMF